MIQNKVLQVGCHAVTCSSLEHPCVEELATSQPVQILYSDPPWGDRHLKYFMTLRKKQTGEDGTPISHAEMLEAFSRLISAASPSMVFVETGPGWIDEFSDHFSYLKHKQVVPVTYDGGRPSYLFFGSTDGRAWRHKLENKSGYKMVKEIIESVAVPDGGAVLDPCCGMGYTAQACVDLGLPFLGNELNAHRLKKTIARLEK